MSEREVVFYLDGRAENAGAYNPGYVFSTNVGIGTRGDGLQNSWLGLIDEVQIHNRALTPAEIQAYARK